MLLIDHLKIRIIQDIEVFRLLTSGIPIIRQIIIKISLGEFVSVQIGGQGINDFPVLIGCNTEFLSRIIVFHQGEYCLPELFNLFFHALNFAQI